MEKLLFLALLFSISANAESLFLGGINKLATGTTVGDHQSLDVNIPGGVAIDPSALETLAKEETLQTLNGKVVVTANGIKVDGSEVTQPVSAASLPLPVGASTSAKQDDGNTILNSIDGKDFATETTLSDLDQKVTTTADGIKVDGSAVTQPVSAASLPLPAGAATSSNQTTGNSSLSSIDTKTPALVGGKVPVDSSGSTVSANQSGTWNVNNVSGTVSLPTGASTAANQSTGNASLSSIDGKFGSLGQKTMAGSAPMVIASDQSPLATKAPLSVTGSISTASISSASTVTAPASTAGFLIQADDTNTANLRFAVGSTASASNGIQLQPGRSEYVPLGANISICPESGTQKYIVQWVSQ